MKNTFEVTEWHHRSLNIQLATPVPGFAHGYKLAKYSTRAWLDIYSYDRSINLGVAKLPNTGLLVAFTVGDTKKPVAARNFQPELHVDYYNIDTVGTPNGIAAKVGNQCGLGWCHKEAFYDYH